jgi:hypothetical protein
MTSLDSGLRYRLRRSLGLVRMGVVSSRVALFDKARPSGPGGRRQTPTRRAHAFFFLPRRMRSAANAAPKPLSMFTTVTPDAQLVSIPKSAVIPCSEAP